MYEGTDLLFEEHMQRVRESEWRGWFKPAPEGMRSTSEPLDSEEILLGEGWCQRQDPICPYAYAPCMLVRGHQGLHQAPVEENVEWIWGWQYTGHRVRFPKVVL